MIFSSSVDGTARIWSMISDFSKAIRILEFAEVDAHVTSVAISPDGKLVAVGSLDAVVWIWEIHSAQLIERLHGHRHGVCGVAFTPGGRGLVSSSLDKSLKFWDLGPLLSNPFSLPLDANTVPKFASFENKEGGERRSICVTTFLGHDDYVLSVAVSPDGAWIASGSKDGEMQFWDPQTAEQPLTPQVHEDSGENFSRCGV
jgi:glucose repression regulatory protein TUP1